MPQLSSDRTLPAAVTNLRLGSALKNCGAIGVAAAFDMSTDNCLYVYDDSSIGYTDWTDRMPFFASKCFKAFNPDCTTIALLPLDGRIITGASWVKGGICDGMLLTEKEMCFVEFKTNVTSTNDQTILQRAEEAIEQLWHTFNSIVYPNCAAMSRQLEKLVSIDFHVVFDEEQKITGANASLMDLQDDFLEDKKYPLYFDNEKTST